MPAVKETKKEVAARFKMHEDAQIRRDIQKKLDELNLALRWAAYRRVRIELTVGSPTQWNAASVGMMDEGK